MMLSECGETEMNRMVVKSTTDGDGILHLNLPMGVEEANREVQVTVEPVTPQPMSPAEWQEFIRSTAGKWQGEFERPEQGEYEERTPLS
jgi:hypothetical protein